QHRRCAGRQRQGPPAGQARLPRAPAAELPTVRDYLWHLARRAATKENLGIIATAIAAIIFGLFGAPEAGAAGGGHLPCPYSFGRGAATSARSCAAPGRLLRVGGGSPTVRAAYPGSQSAVSLAYVVVWACQQVWKATAGKWWPRGR